MDEAYIRAKQFFEEEYGDEEIRVHSKTVIDICKDATTHTPTLDSRIFEIAGWIHDIGRKDDNVRHHEIGLKYLDKFLKQYPEYTSLKEEIADCILNHRTGQSPTTPYGKIIQVADKLSFYHKEMIEYSKKSPKTSFKSSPKNL